MKTLTALLLVFCTVTYASSQGFITPFEEEDYTTIYNQPCTALLTSGDELTGRLVGASGTNGYLNTISIKTESGEKRKLKPEEIKKLMIKASGFTKLALITESTTSIRELTETNFDEIINREYIIYETALSHNKEGKTRLLQLLNPGFDSKIKVYVDPNAQETMGLGLAGVKLTGGKDKSLLFVTDGEKAIKVKKGNYKENFQQLYAKCPKMLEAFAGEKLKWQDVAGHVFVYDQICQE
jgi:hypothetical protein